VFPALAVARVLAGRGHRLLFIGTREGIESRLVSEAGYEMEFIRSGGLNRVGVRKQIQSALRLPVGIAAAGSVLGRFRPEAIFSTGGFVAGPVMIAAALRHIPLIVMEPNMVPGFANRKVARYVYRALVGFEATQRCFPEGRSEVTGLPVRPEFFAVNRKIGGAFTVLITGGSRGARTLNRASRESWHFFREGGADIRIIHQTGTAEHAALAKEFIDSGLEGEVVPFISNMACAFAQADIVLARAGAGSVNEIAAAGKPSILVPLPFAADDHQRKNAQMLVDAGAARMVLDGEMNGERLFREIETLRENRAELDQMGERVRQFAHPGAAERAADVMEEAASRSK
jgi:UDP-N-acetylglucosamine--N-acetylmuramyl-(pentapeptide) pyrophosphoryl-undecaprenol N-acetylglucosamine transferase